MGLLSIGMAERWHWMPDLKQIQTVLYIREEQVTYWRPKNWLSIRKSLDKKRWVGEAYKDESVSYNNGYSDGIEVGADIMYSLAYEKGQKDLIEQLKKGMD